MAMVVKNNMSAVRTLNTLNTNSSALQKSLAKVSSGMKINSAQDDASGYAISERMRVQIRSLDQANQNTQNASSLMKTAEGAVSSTMEILKTLKEKAINAATDTNTDSDRATIQKELNQYIDQIDDNALTTFNGKYLVDGSKSQQGVATYTKMTNQSLQVGTTGQTALTALHNRNNESLEIKSTDYLTASYVKDGETYTTKFKVGANTLEDVFKALDGEDDSTAQIFKNATGAITDPTGAGNAGSSSTPTSKSGLSNAKLEALASYTGGAGDVDAIASEIIAGNLKYEDVEALGKTATADITAALTSETADFKNGAAAAINGTVLTHEDLDGSGNSGTATVAELTAKSGNTANMTNLNASNDALKVAYADGTAISGTNTSDSNENNAYTIAAASGVLVSNDVTVVAGNIADSAVTAGKAKSTEADINAAVAKYAATLTLTPTNTGSGQLKNAATSAAVAGTSDVAELTTAILEDKAKTAIGDLDASKLTSIKNKVDAAGGGHTADQSEIVMADTYIGKNTAGDDVNTPDGTEGLTISSASTGIGGQVAGVTISITDSEGNVKKSANAALDAFKTTIYAKNASDPNELTFQVGAAANQAITVGLDDMRAEALGLKGADGSKVSVATQDKANAAVAVFDNAIQKVLDQQATIGAIESRLEYTSNNLTTSSENVQAAESTIRDADMAKEMTNYTKNNVLLQAAQSMLAQANQNSSAVLSLLQ